MWSLSMGLTGGEIFYTLRETKVLIERWCQRYKTIRSLGYRLRRP